MQSTEARVPRCVSPKHTLVGRSSVREAGRVAGSGWGQWPAKGLPTMVGFELLRSTRGRPPQGEPAREHTTSLVCTRSWWPLPLRPWWQQKEHLSRHSLLLHVCSVPAMGPCCLLGSPRGLFEGSWRERARQEPRQACGCLMRGEKLLGRRQARRAQVLPGRPRSEPEADSLSWSGPLGQRPTPFSSNR